MDKTGKVWGHTSQIFCHNNVEVCRIVGVKGGRSSTHMHASKVSMLFVESGSIVVYTEKTGYDLVDKTELAAGESTTILPGEYHRFEISADDTIVYEIYWVELNKNDIVRRDCGSLVKDN